MRAKRTIITLKVLHFHKKAQHHKGTINVTKHSY